MKKYQVHELVPHSGRMSLLSDILSYSTESLQAQVLISKHSMFAENDGVPAWVGVEYLAQTIGAYAGMLAREIGDKPKLGFLLGTRKYSCNVAVFPLDSLLTIEVTKELIAENGLSVFNCTLTGDCINAAARLNVYQPEDAEQFLKEASSE